MSGVIFSDFMVGKLALLVGTFILLGCTFSLAETSGRFQENQQLETLLSEISGVLEAAGGLSGDVEIDRRLPALSGVEVEITGKLSGGVERVWMTARAHGSLTREIRVPAIVNGGSFRLVLENPSEISVRKEAQEVNWPAWFLFSWLFGKDYKITTIWLEVR